jgi:hypothetical protein
LQLSGAVHKVREEWFLNDFDGEKDDVIMFFCYKGTFFVMLLSIEQKTEN